LDGPQITPTRAPLPPVLAVLAGWWKDHLLPWHTSTQKCPPQAPVRILSTHTLATLPCLGHSRNKENSASEGRVRWAHNRCLPVEHVRAIAGPGGAVWGRVPLRRVSSINAISVVVGWRGRVGGQEGETNTGVSPLSLLSVRWTYTQRVFNTACVCPATRDSTSYRSI